MSENFDSEIERHFCGAVSEPAKTTSVDAGGFLMRLNGFGREAVVEKVARYSTLEEAFHAHGLLVAELKPYYYVTCWGGVPEETHD